MTFTETLSSEFSSLTNKASGNGGGYEGKPDGLYLRYLPQYACEGQQTFKDSIKVIEGKFYIYENNFNQCSITPRELHTDEIGISPFQSTFITANDFLFKRFDSKPETIPDLLPEVLCRDDFSNPNLEIVTHFNRTSGQAVTRIYYYKNDLPDPSNILWIEDNETHRLFSEKSVSYSAFDNQFKFEVNLTKGFGAHLRVFSAAISQFSKILPEATRPMATAQLSCVTGGGIDTQTWPLRIAIENKVEKIKIQNSTGDIYFDVHQPSNPNWHHLWRYKMKEGIYQNLTSDIMGALLHVSNYFFIDNADKKIVVLGNPSNDIWNHYAYIIDLDKQGSARQFMNVGGEKSENIDNLYGLQEPFFRQVAPNVFSSVIQKIQMTSGVGVPGEHLYRLFNYDQRSSKDYLVSSTPSAMIQLPSSDKVISFITDSAGNVSLQFLTVNSTLTTKILDLPKVENCIPDASPKVWNVQNLVFSSISQRVFFQYICNNNPASTKIYSISLLGDVIPQVVATNYTITWSSADGETLLLSKTLDSDSGKFSRYEAGQSVLLRSMDLKMASTRIDPLLNYSSDPTTLADRLKYIYMPGYIAQIAQSQNKDIFGLSSGFLNSKAYGFNSETLGEIPVCTNAKGDQISVGQIKDGPGYLMTYDKTQQAFYFYELSLTSSCRILNTLPAKKFGVHFFASTPKGFGLTIRDNNTVISSSDSYEDAIFVPVDGRAPLYLNPDGREFRYVSQMLVSPDQKQVYFLGYKNSSDLISAALYVFTVH